MKRTKLLSLTAIALTTCGLSLSALAVTPLPMGWYAEGNVGSSKTNNVNYGAGTTYNGSGLGWNVDIGYKFMPYFGMEVGYTSYKKVKIESSTTQVAKSTHYSYDIAGKGILPLNDSGFDLFAKLGYVRISADTSITNTAAASGLTIATGSTTSSGIYAAIGGEYSFLPNLATNLQWARAKGNSRTGNLDLYSVGLTYLFG